MHNTSPYLEGTNDIIPCGSACEALNFLQQIYNSAPVCMLAVDPKNCVIRLNQRLADFAGKDISDCPGLALEELLPVGAAQLKAVCAQVFKSKTAVLNQEISFSKNEQKVFWAVNAYPVTYDQTSSLTVSLIINDISELRNTQIGLEKAYQENLTLQVKLKQENQALKSHLSYNFEDNTMLGSSPSLKQVLFQIHKVAPTDATVLITGDTGTGKELAAREIHRCSRRASQPLIVVNCAALPANLIESELFGHEKGAFTGATGELKGRFELADGGTLFLDEIGEISPAFQAKLLRVLQEREFERVGGSKSIRVDVRFIFATNRDLEQAVAKGEFRADLYYRINVVTLSLPPLRQRHDDIPLLAQHFLEKFNRDNQRNLLLGQDALRIMLCCNWPGNVRELENCVERAAAMNRGEVIHASDLACQNNRCFSLLLPPCPEVGTRPVTIPVVAAEADHFSHPETAGDHGIDADAAGGLVDRERLLRALEQCGWVQAKAARLLRLTPRQIGYAIRKHGIAVKQL